MGDDDANPFSAVPLFPLPNVVLFPRAVLPLHIFEERYKEMTAAALRGDRQTAMAPPRPGWGRGARLPRRISEERDKEMPAAALRGDRQIAMALLRPGWERDYYHKPQVEPVV